VNGEKVYFTDEASAELTTTTESGSGANLYEYDVSTGVLTDLTPVARANVLGFSGISENGSRVYFAAEGVLAVGGTTLRPNLYMSENGGTIAFIATLEREALKNPTADRESRNWQSPEAEQFLRSEASPSGEYFAFTSIKSLTGYGNEDVKTGQLVEEVFLYDADTKSLSCASCDPGGAAPTGQVGWSPTERLLEAAGPGRQVREVLDDGAVFFTTPDALVGEDLNGVADVYEYREGGDHLISSGTSPQPSAFYEADPSGEDVFFVTTQSLVKRDTDNALSLYDARVGGGFAEPPEAASPCEDEACRGPVAGSQMFSSPISSTFVGPGDAVPAPAKEASQNKAKPRKRVHKMKASSKEAHGKKANACRHAKSRAGRSACRRRASRRHHDVSRRKAPAAGAKR
jgi:hypothetical protein